MSADSSKRQTKQGITGQIVLPQPVNDPSIIDSVAGFIHEVVPQACQSVLSAAGGGEINKEAIIWAKFHSTDYNDPENFLTDTECQSDSVPPLLIVLGYGSGVQVWGISGGGEGREVLSYPHGNVRCLQILYSPQVHPGKDVLASKRPLIAIVDNTGPGPQYQTLNFISLRTAEVVKSIKFKTQICDIVCNKKSVVITFAERIAIFDVLTLEDRLTVTTCYLSPGINPNPVALGPRWLAYCDKKLTTWQRSSGGCEDEGAQSYTATVIHAAKSLGKGLRDLSGSLTGTVAQPQSNTSQPGIVTVIDIETPRSSKHQGVEEDESNASNMVAHFVGHTGPIVAMTFDPSGLLLVIADKHGHRFNVFRLHPHPSSPALAAVHHLYILHRGDTTARVQDVSVSWDSRWVAVSSLRGTTHVFPITPYGGPVAVRTHTTPHVVNRLSRFERSAGLSDGRGSPEGAASVLGGSPRLPPYPHPVVLTPLAQIRRTPTGLDSTESTPVPTVLRLGAKFAPPRALLPPRATPPRTPRHQPKPRVADSLFIISSYGSLVQYDIEPRSPANVPKDKISYDTGIEVSVEAKGEWVLLRPPCLGAVQPPLPQGNPLLPPAPLTTTHSTRLVETHTPQLHHPAKGHDDRWLSQVEIITHTGPHRRLWMGPQFSFKSLDQSNLSEGEPPEPENVPPRSNPVNMPRRPYLWIESSSGGSVDAPYMTDNSEDDSIHGETRLREDLADAMMDTALHASGGVVEGGDKALERRITQFGLVVPISPVVLPDVRVPLPPSDLTSRDLSAGLPQFEDAVTLAVASSSSLHGSGIAIYSDVPLEFSEASQEHMTPPDSPTSIKTVKEWSEVATSTYDAPTNLSLLTRVDAQTDTSLLELPLPSVSDKSLNTSMLFEPLHLPLTSSSSDNSDKTSKQSESATSIEKSNSSSDNVSGLESNLKKNEKTGKKSKKKKHDSKDKYKKKIEEVISCSMTSPSYHDQELLTASTSELIIWKDSVKKPDMLENPFVSMSNNSRTNDRQVTDRAHFGSDNDSSKMCNSTSRGASTISDSSVVDSKQYGCTGEMDDSNYDSNFRESDFILDGIDNIVGNLNEDATEFNSKVRRMSKEFDANLIKNEILTNTINISLETEVEINANVEILDEFTLETQNITELSTIQLLETIQSQHSAQNIVEMSLDSPDDIEDVTIKSVNVEKQSADVIASSLKDIKESVVFDICGNTDHVEKYDIECSSGVMTGAQEVEVVNVIDLEPLMGELADSRSVVLANVPINNSVLGEEELDAPQVSNVQRYSITDATMTASSVSKKESKSKKKKKGGDKMRQELVKPIDTVITYEIAQINNDSVLASSIGSQFSEPEQTWSKDNDITFTVDKSTQETSLDHVACDPFVKVVVATSKDKVKAMESTESIENSGKDIPAIPRKKGKSGKKNKAKQTAFKEGEESVLCESVSIDDSRIELDGSMKHSDLIKETNHNEVSQEFFLQSNVEIGTEEAAYTHSEIDTVTATPSDSVSALEDNSDQISAIEATNDTINKSDSELFVPVIEKRKKKRKNVKESMSKTDGKENSTSVTDVDISKREESGLEVGRSRRESRSNAKSPSPSPKADVVADSESSDEAIITEVKAQTPKLPKRKKLSKRSDTSETRETEIDIKTKSEGTSDIDYETCSEKKSDSSVDSFFDRIRSIDPFSKSWSRPVGEDKANIDDRDSVYESCNDDEFLNVASSSIPIESVLEPIPVESSSSMTEDKTDSGDKDIPGPSHTSCKKHKKQKKKKR